MKLKAILITTTFMAVLAAGCTSSDHLETAAVDPETASIAHEGYDTVAYFAADKATNGNVQFGYVWKGAKWLFANRGNLEKFKSNPERFVPRFGSHCPVSLANGRKDRGNPRFGKVFKDKLYFFASKDYRDQFVKEPNSVLEKASTNYKTE